jgi:hypothetical protein
MGVTATDRPPCPIQRILLFHTKLYERSFERRQSDTSNADAHSNSNPTLGENASIEELSESILYYHQDRRAFQRQQLKERRRGNNNIDDDNNNNSNGGGASGDYPTVTTAATMMTEAVQFLGLCTALYSLPSVLDDVDDDDDNENDKQKENQTEDGKIISVPFDETSTKVQTEDDDDDETQAIYLSRSMLIFVPLETSSSSGSKKKNKDILAVIQVARLYPNNDGGDGDDDYDHSDGSGKHNSSSSSSSTKNPVGGGHPRAIRRSIEQWHQMFCLLYGGGILHRMGSYDGMAQLYGLLKDIRKLRVSYARCGGTNNKTKNENGDNRTVIERQIAAKQDEVRQFRKRLAGQSIRRDLDAHYKEYLSEYAFIFSRNGGVGRCLVECTPTPIAVDNASHTFQSIPSSLASSSQASVKESIRQLLVGTKTHQTSSLSNSTKHDGQMKILGIATFHTGELIDFQMKRTTDDRGDGPTVQLFDAVRSLMSYMASHRTKMHLAFQQREGVVSMGGNNAVNQAPLGIGKVALSFTSMGIGGNVAANQSSTMGLTSEQGNAHFPNLERGQFLQSPPSYMMSKFGKRTQSIVYGGSHNIWAPRVALPTRENTILEANMILFDYLQFSFLVFVDLNVSSNEVGDEIDGTCSMRGEVMKLEEGLSEAALLALHNIQSAKEPECELLPRMQSQTGQLVLGVHRSDKKMILILDPDEPLRHNNHNRHTMKATNEKPVNKILRFFKLGRYPARSRGGQERATFNQLDHKYTSLEWSALGLDCRHLLASRLPLDACLALDDIIDEAQSRRDAASGKAIVDDYEVCISMPFGWILAMVRGGREIYVCFDSSFVTVTDVQTAAASIAKEIEDIWIPAIQ